MTMTDKERVEEMEEHINRIDEGDLTDRGKMLEYRHLAYKLLKIASEQADRAEELERDYYVLGYEQMQEIDNELDSLRNQNKRYRDFINTLEQLICPNCDGWEEYRAKHCHVCEGTRFIYVKYDEEE